MKSLLYKEFKLAMHPLIYIFVFVFPLMALIPNYPIVISFIYVCSCYPILFLGANKGQQSNDIYFSCLLPVRRKDIVKVRLFLLSIIQLISIVLVTIYGAIGSLYKEDILIEAGDKISDVGFGFGQIGSVIGFVLLCFSIYDLIFVTCFYKSGRAIVSSTLLGMLGFMILLCITTLLLPIAITSYFYFFSNIYVQIITVILGVIIYFLIHYLTYIKASKLFEKVDF